MNSFLKPSWLECNASSNEYSRTATQSQLNTSPKGNLQRNCGLRDPFGPVWNRVPRRPAATDENRCRDLGCVGFSTAAERQQGRQQQQVAGQRGRQQGRHHHAEADG